MSRKVPSPNGEETLGALAKLHGCRLLDIFRSPNIVRTITHEINAIFERN
jgi:hypothetical protein